MNAPIFILAGEPSGDQLAASIMQAIDGAYGKQDWFGVGGSQMQALGLRSEAEMGQLSVMGFGAAIKAYPALSRLADHLVNRVLETRPKAVMTIDAKGFSLRFARRLKQRMRAEGWHAPIIHTVAPTVWAWGGWRAKGVAKAVDGLLCLFPFEPEHFAVHGVHAHFIGHPEAFNPALNLPDLQPRDDQGPRRLLILPGSRRSEIEHILPVMRDAVNRMQQAGPLSVSLVTMPHLKDQVTAILGAASDIEIWLGADTLYAELNRADAVMAASGTVTLQTALAGLPGVACYRTSALSAFVGRRLVRMDRVILPNALLGRAVYPFLFQEAATPEALAEAAAQALNSDRNMARQTGDELRTMLRGGATQFSDLVAHAVREWFGSP